jgi:hypothetical protein
MESLNKITEIYLKVIKKWKNRYDVQNGEALAYRKGQSLHGPYDLSNKPHSIGEGLTLTGFCVSTSQALLYDPIFQLLLNDRGAFAKLISIDIKERFYGSCYSGSQNKWHTAILVDDHSSLFVIDMTCAQFGNDFVNKMIWDFQTWENTFRSAHDKHVISDFDNKPLTVMPLEKRKSSISDEIVLIDGLKDVTTITDNERKILSDFFLNRISILNRKLILGNVNNFDFAYVNKINKLLKCFSFEDIKAPVYSILEFDTEKASKAYLDKVISGQKDGSYTLKQYMLFSDSLVKSAKYNNIDLNKVNSKKVYDSYYIVFIINKGVGIDLSCIDNLSIGLIYGIKMYTDFEKQLYNGNKLLANPTVKTNTFYIESTVNIG